MTRVRPGPHPRVLRNTSPPPTLTLTLPRPTEVAGLRLEPSGSALPTHPTLVAVDLGDGPQVRSLEADGGPQSVPLHPRVTDTVRISLLDWNDVIDRTALGFDQLKPPGLAEVTALTADGTPIAAADAEANRSRTIEVPCGQGPVIAAPAGSYKPRCPPAWRSCSKAARSPPGPAIPPAGAAGRQPGIADQSRPGVHADGADLSGPLAAKLTGTTGTLADITAWSADRRQIRWHVRRPPGRWRCLRA